MANHAEGDVRVGRGYPPKQAATATRDRFQQWRGRYLATCARVDEAMQAIETAIRDRMLRTIIQASQNRWRRSRWLLRPSLECLGAFVVLIALATVVYVFPWLKGAMKTNTNIDAVVIVLVIAIAFGLYRLRKHWRFCYAIVELFAGMWVILLAVKNLPQDVTLQIHDSFLVQFLAGLYVIIRAFDNISLSKAYDGVRAEGARMDAVLLEKRTRRQALRASQSVTFRDKWRGFFR
jgi:hypothetical protein